MGKSIKVAVIDMNEGSPNQGMRGILDILSNYKEAHQLDLSYDVFDLRTNNEIPGTGYDIYISSGGPGSPLESEGTTWETLFFNLLDEIERYNHTHLDKKQVFLICHSFQLACRKYNMGTVAKRRSIAFGIFSVTLTTAGLNDPIFKGLPNPFYAVDSREYQVTDPEKEFNTESDITVLAMEKERKHIDLDRCIMAIRFTKEIIGTQFHPEADPVGMSAYLLEEDKKNEIISAHGPEKYETMLSNLQDPQKIVLTQSLVLPNFLDQAIQNIK